MPNNNEDVKSQFETNYLGDVDLKRFCERTGVKYYHVWFFLILNDPFNCFFFNFKFDDATNIENNELFKEIRQVNGYNYEDRVIVSPDTMGSEYLNKVNEMNDLLIIIIYVVVV